WNDALGCRGADGAKAGDLDEHPCGAETGIACSAVDRVKRSRCGYLGDHRATLAGEHDLTRTVLAVGGMASEVGVATFETMHDAHLQQRVKRPIDGDRRHPRTLLARQPLQDL